MTDIEIKDVESKVCDFFGVAQEELPLKTVGGNLSNARHYLWFILHCMYGMSNKEVADRYGRSRRKVINYISEVKFRVAHQREDIALYEGLKNIL